MDDVEAGELTSRWINAVDLAALRSTVTANVRTPHQTVTSASLCRTHWLRHVLQAILDARIVQPSLFIIRLLTSVLRGDPLLTPFADAFNSAADNSSTASEEAVSFATSILDRYCDSSSSSDLVTASATSLSLATVFVFQSLLNPAPRIAVDAHHHGESFTDNVVLVACISLSWMRCHDISGVASYDHRCVFSRGNARAIHGALIDLLARIPVGCRCAFADAASTRRTINSIATSPKFVAAVANALDALIDDHDPDMFRHVAARLEAAKWGLSTRSRPASACCRPQLPQQRRDHHYPYQWPSLADLVFDCDDDDHDVLRASHPFFESRVIRAEHRRDRAAWLSGAVQKRDAVLRSIPAVASAMTATHTSSASERRRFCHVDAPLCDVVPPSYATERVVLTRITASFEEQSPFKSQSAASGRVPTGISGAEYRDASRVTSRPCSAHRPHSALHHRALLVPAACGFANICRTSSSLASRDVMREEDVREVLTRRPSGANFFLRTVNLLGPSVDQVSKQVAQRSPTVEVACAVQSQTAGHSSAGSPAIAASTAARHSVLKPFVNRVPLHVTRLRSSALKRRGEIAKPVP